MKYFKALEQSKNNNVDTESAKIEVSDDSRAQLVEFAARKGKFDLRDPGDKESRERVSEMLGLISATPEFQFA